MEKLTVAQARDLAMRACRACGGGEAMAASLAQATLSAEAAGRPEVGFAHLPDYLDSLLAGRIDGAAEPQMRHVLPAFIHVDACGGIAQEGFDLAFATLADAARQLGVAVLTVSGSYTAGEIGYYVRRLAAEGLVSIACANAHAMVAPAAGIAPAYGTNPIAFGAPLPDPLPPLVFDQSTSATAFVNVARAAQEGRPIPTGWAVDKAGKPTTVAAEAVLGALLPFGGFKGANMALMVEILSAGVAGANWSLDAGHFRQGSRSPGVGLTVLALSPVLTAADGADFRQRLAAEVSRLKEMGVHIPGLAARNWPLPEDAFLEIGASDTAALRARADSPSLA